MIIDLILDRYHGDAYDPKKFYDAVMDYEEGTEYPISRALDGGEEEDVKRALCDYIDGEYNPNIKKYINAVEWLVGDDGKDYSKEIDIMAEKKESLGKKDEMKVTPEVEALFAKGEDGHSQIYNGLCDVCEGTTAHDLQYEEAQEPSRWVSANLVFDESGYEVLVYDYGENEISYSIKDEYGNNLKDYISAARGAPLGKQQGYTPGNIDDMWIALEDDLGKLESDSENESKNESDFGAFDWTVTVSYIDKETGDKVSDVFLIKAHNMPSAKEQAILRANRKGTDAKVDSCRMGDYVSNESKTSEASPRKFGKQESKSMNKCSMQKMIESLSKKNETVGDELPYGFMQYRDDDTNEWLPVLVSVNENPRGWYYDGIAPTDNLGGFGYEEYSRGFLKTCKPGTGKCDPELVKAMKTFYIDSANKDGLKPIEVDDLTAYIPKGKVYIGKE